MGFLVIAARRPGENIVRLTHRLAGVTFIIPHFIILSAWFGDVGDSRREFR